MRSRRSTGATPRPYSSADSRALAVNGVFAGIQGRQSAYLLDESEGGTVRITDTRNNKTRYRGKRKHELWAIARCAWINLRRLMIFEAGTAPKGTTSGQNDFFFAISAILKVMSQTFGHLIFCFYSPAATRKWAWTD